MECGFHWFLHAPVAFLQECAPSSVTCTLYQYRMWQNPGEYSTLSRSVTRKDDDTLSKSVNDEGRSSTNRWNSLQASFQKNVPSQEHTNGSSPRRLPCYHLLSSREGTYLLIKKTTNFITWLLIIFTRNISNHHKGITIKAVRHATFCHKRVRTAGGRVAEQTGQEWNYVLGCHRSSMTSTVLKPCWQHRRWHQ